MRGGLRLIAHKDCSVASPLTDASVPPKLVLQLRGDVDRLVTIDDRVLLGQQLFRTEDRVFHAPVSGKISAIEQAKGTTTITIDNDGKDSRHPDMAPIDDYAGLAPPALRERIAHAGIVGLGGACFPTMTKVKAAANRRATLLIVNGAECEPFITCDDALMREHADEVVCGTQTLLHASEATHAVIAIEADKPVAIKAIANTLTRVQDSRLRLQVVENYYPAGGERQLITAITQREVPSGGSPPDIGVLCQNVGTAVAIARLIKTGEPLISRVVTITGDGIREPRNLRVRFGTPIACLIADCGGYTGDIVRLIMGGTMMGLALSSDDVAVTAATNCVIAALATNLAPRGFEMPCIRCGDCAEACPANLLPQQLLRYARQQNHAALTELGIDDCIECGCCDYVCPSQIPLTATFVAAHAQTPK